MPIIILLILSVGVFIYSIILLQFQNETTHLKKQYKEIEEIGKNSRFMNDESSVENLSFNERVIYPIIDRLSIFFGKMFPISPKEQDKLNLQLMQAGIKMKAPTFLTIRILIIGASVFLAYFAVQLYNWNFMMTFIVSIGGGLYAGYAISRFTLLSRITQRQNKMDKQLPGFLDLLSVCVEAGLGFDQAVQYVCREYNGELSEEFRAVIRDISLGSTRKQALTSLTQRVTSPQMRTFTAAVLQADEMGISLKNILNAQSKSIRIAYKQKIEEKAQKLSTKILIPMMLFIFPVIFIIILGPAVPGLVKAFGK